MSSQMQDMLFGVVVGGLGVGLIWYYGSYWLALGVVFALWGNDMILGK